MAKLESNRSDSIRQFVRSTYIDPARQRGERRVRVVAGDVHKELGLHNRMPLVCTALRSRRLLTSAGLSIVSDEGPPSGMSSTVAITYELSSDADASEPESGPAAPPASRLETFRRLRGIARDTFATLGGGEKFIRGERQRFFDEDDK